MIKIIIFHLRNSLSISWYNKEMKIISDLYTLREIGIVDRAVN